MHLETKRMHATSGISPTQNMVLKAERRTLPQRAAGSILQYVRVAVTQSQIPDTWYITIRTRQVPVSSTWKCGEVKLYVSPFAGE